MIKRLWALTVLLILLIPLRGQGYNIEISIKGLSNDTLILGHYFTTRMIPTDTVVLDNRGRGVF
ncbi:MAG TPA: hypothetical protein ENN61_01465, partial [Bacteroidaceae bacterium]|nr:hypothetical protein [Bacteroidaceae bacterium]